MSSDFTPYPVFEIQPDWVLEPEALGSKAKFWYRDHASKQEWLFKFPQENTGQHWSEKIAAEVADCMDTLHAPVELAVFQGVRGSATESFAREGRELYHGNQVLAGRVLRYDPARTFGQSSHTLESVLRALDGAFRTPEAARRAKARLAEYLVLDALVGNTDRHHENWGILRKRTEGGWVGMMAPTFDHASSLGRELVDEGPGRSRRRLLEEGRVGTYSERARGAIFWKEADAHGVSPLELARRAAGLHPDLFRPALGKLAPVDRASLQAVVDRVPESWMSDLARRFAVELMCYNLNQLGMIRHE